MRSAQHGNPTTAARAQHVPERARLKAAPQASSRAPLSGAASCACGGGCPRCEATPQRSGRPFGAAASAAPAPSPYVAIYGSASRHANEAEAERVARAVPGMPQAPLASEERAQLRGLPHRSASVALPSAGKALPDSVRSTFERAFNYDLGSVRLHDDAPARFAARGIGAAAFTAGNHIAVASPRYGPQHPLGRHILAHEVAHVIQTALHPSAPAIHRYESPEHEDLGDAGLDELLAFLQTDAGDRWAKEHHLDAAKLVEKIKADPLKMAGGKIITGTRSIGDKGKTADVGLTPGEIIALSGDLYSGPNAIASAASSPLAGKGAKNEIDKLLEAIGQERRGELADANATYDTITKGRYIKLAKDNDTHFAPLNRAEWRRLHMQAIAEATGAQDEPSLQHALLVDAAGGHFLTDAYASGHLFKKNEVVAAIDKYLASNPLRTENPEAQLYAGFVTLHGDADQLVLKAIHDRMNVDGFDVTNALGMAWRTYGDKQLAKAEDTRRIASLAIFMSRQQIYAARRGEKPDPKEVEAYMPDDSTIEKATMKAIAYIPAAAAEAQGVMYRGRGLAATQFPFPLGAIIGSNLSTIAGPGRERQLLDLEQSSSTSGSGPRLAPQFTVFDWK